MFRKSLRYLLGLFLILSFQQSFASGTCSTSIPPCPGFTTYTQGGWGGSNCSNGYSPASFLAANFSAAFPNGLTIGCNNKIVLTSATAVKNFLPQGSTARILNVGILTNPTKSSYSNVLAGQLAAAMLNVGFDQKFSTFGSSNTNLGDLVISSGVFQNWTVSQLLTEANKFIGGCPSSTGKTAADYNTALTSINQSYDNGISSGNFLLCPITFNASVTPVKCFGGNSGSASITNITGGAGAPYSILWSTGATTLTINNLIAGTYTFTIKDAIGLTKTGSITITQPTQLVANAYAGKILCKGGSTTVTVSANGGSAPYSGTGNFNVAAGTYNYTVTDANGCTASTSITITEPTILNATSSAGTILCNGGTTTVTVSGNGGTAPYSGTGSFKVGAGNYNYTVTDANGCSASTSITITEPTILHATSSAGTILCNGGTTTVTVSGNGGTAPYAGTGTFTVKAGTYNYTVTDANGCTATTSITITEPALLTAATSAGTILCNGGSTTVVVSGNGGTLPYTGTDTFNVKADTYNYTITDANGCTATTSITVTEPALLTASSDAGTILCNGGSTTVNVGANGGTTPYSGDGNFSVNAGTYNYTITDANGCTATTSITVSEPSLLTASSNAGLILCNGGSTTVNVGANGGTTPYTGDGNFTVNAGTYNYTITDANGCTTTTSITVSEPSLLTASSNAGLILCNGGSTTVNVGGNGGTTPYVGTGNFTVNAGTFNYTVTDANGCSATTSVTVSEPSLLTASSNAGLILCNGGSTTVNVGGNGGTTPYVGTGNFTVNAGTFNYTVTDANGCSATTSVTVAQPSLLTASSNAGSIMCNGGTTTVNVGGNGGTTPYTGTGNFTVNVGTFNYTVTDANGCSATTSVTVTQPSNLVVSGNSTNDNSCNGGSCSATANVNVNGGTSPYTYTWTNNASTTNAATGFCANTATTVTVKDANGCTATKNFSFICIPNPCPPCNGYVTYTQGGWGATPNGNNPGTILNNNFATAFPNGLTIGCTNKLVFTSAAAVRAFLPSGTTARALNAGTLTNPTSSSYKNVLAGQLVAAMLSAKIDASVTTFAPSSGKLQNLVINSGTFKNMTVGQVINAANQFIGGCTSSYTATDFNTVLTAINQSWDNGTSCGGTNILSCPITVTKTIAHNPCYGDSKGSINLSTCGGCGSYTYNWSNGAATANISNLTAGVYIVTVTDNCGLSKKDTVTITEPTQISISTSTIDDNSCNGGDCSGEATASVSGGTTPYLYAWDNGATTATATNLCSGTAYTVTITDANGCQAVSSVTVNCTVIDPPSGGDCDPLTTFTQGGWGSTPNGNNPGMYLQNNFQNAFANTGGITIGTAPNTLTFKSYSDVSAVLPAGGSPATISGAQTNPSKLNNVFAGQLLAATLNVKFDYYDVNFAAPTRNLGKAYCNFAPFLGLNVDQVLAEANLAIAGLPTQNNFSISDLNMALDFINRNYDNGNTDNGDLICSDPYASRGMNPSNSSNTNTTATSTTLSNTIVSNTTGINVYPNPANSSEVTINFNSNKVELATLSIYNMTGQLLMQQNINTTIGTNNVKLNIESFKQNNNYVLIQLVLNNQTYKQSLIINK